MITTTVVVIVMRVCLSRYSSYMYMYMYMYIRSSSSNVAYDIFVVYVIHCMNVEWVFSGYARNGESHITLT